ncbi:MAG: glutathione peroxidase [Planctomycetota bacterium]|nr:glutathione peroxidase [Planctomycetota bacterium]
MAWAVTVAALACCAGAQGVRAEEKKVASIHEFSLKGNDGKDQKFDQYKGKVVLLVNVASKCGYTPQYKQLEAVYAKYKDQGLVVVGVPCNDFGGQEPGTDLEIKQFCSTKFNVTFPLMSKVHVQGAETPPLYKYLTADSPKPGKIKWNFEKFLIGKHGEVLDRYESKIKPDDPAVTKAIEDALKAK